MKLKTIKFNMKNVFYWIIALLITLSSVAYQRMTGPTNPKNIHFELSGKEYNTELPRSMETTISLEDAKGDYSLLNKTGCLEIEIPKTTETMQVFVFYRRYPGNDTIHQVKASKIGDIYSVELPAQPPAGKIAYFVQFSDGDNTTTIGMMNNIIIRFKNPVPAWALVPHIILMFIAILLSTFTGVLAFTKKQNVNKYALLVIIILGIGGLFFGPIVQKFAFGDFWTGWPFGKDLTDNKVLVIFILWLAAWIVNKQKSRKWLYTAVAVIMLLVYSIPHSTAGSEYNYTTGRVVTGANQ